MKLKGLYGLSGSVVFNNFSDRDILDFYAPGTTTLPDSSAFMGANLCLRYHVNDWFYACLGWDWLSKAFEISNASLSKETYEWDAFNPYAAVGFTFFKGANSFLDLEAGAGKVMLHDSSYTLIDPHTSTSPFAGSASTFNFGLGGTWFLIPLLGVDFQAGYRLARLDASAVDTPCKNVSGNKPFIDFSGPLARVGLCLYLGMPDPFADMASPRPQVPAQAQPVSGTAGLKTVSPTAAP
jgi:hypothetical protein